MKRIGVLTMMLSLLLVACQQETANEVFVKSVITVKPEVESGEYIKKLPGEIKEASEISLGFKTAGEISNIYVKEGTFVKQGQLLASLDDTDYKLGVEIIQTQYDQLSREVDRLKKLYENNSVSGNDYDKAASGLKQLELQLQTNKNKLAYTKLYAPVTGSIQSVNFEESEMVNAGTPLFTILESGKKVVETSIPAVIYQSLHKVKFYRGTVNIGDKKKEFNLSYISVTPKADATQQYTLKLLVNDLSDTHVTSGINVDISMIIDNDNAGTKYYVPIHAVFDNNGQSSVWVLGNDNTVRATAVKVESINEKEQAIITSGINAGDKIVKAGVQSLHQGEKVKELEVASATNVGGVL